MSTVIGYACGALAVSLILFSIRAAGRGGGEGMIPLLAAFGLLLVAVSVLGSGRMRV